MVAPDVSLEIKECQQAVSSPLVTHKTKYKTWHSVVSWMNF